MKIKLILYLTLFSLCSLGKAETNTKEIESFRVFYGFNNKKIKINHSDRNYSKPLAQCHIDINREINPDYYKFILLHEATHCFINDQNLQAKIIKNISKDNLDTYYILQNLSAETHGRSKSETIIAPISVYNEVVADSYSAFYLAKNNEISPEQIRGVVKIREKEQNENLFRNPYLSNKILTKISNDEIKDVEQLNKEIEIFFNGYLSSMSTLMKD